MKAAILGNGPSRVAYSAGGYDLVLGCNFPWTEVDATVIIDINVVQKILKEPELMTWPACYLAHPPYRVAWNKRRYYNQNHPANILLSKCKRKFTLTPWESSGHAAARVAIEEGAKDLWIFGCDSFFEHTVESCTKDYIKNPLSTADRYVVNWRKRWNWMFTNYPAVKFTFVRGIDDYINPVSSTIS